MTPTLDAGRSAVNACLTAGRPARHHRGMPTHTTARTAPGAPYAGDHSEYLRAVARMIRAAGARVADGDPADLAELVELRAHVDAAVDAALRGQAGRHSLVELAAELDVTRQAVHYMVKRAGDRRGGAP